MPDIRPVANCKNPDPANPRQAACHLWNAGEEILNQAPTWDDINAARVTESIGPTRDTLRAGFEGSGQPENYRRILYSMAADGSRVPKGHVPRPRKLFYHSPPDVQDLVDAGVDSQTALNDAREDLWSGLGLYAETFQLGASTDASVWTQASNPTNGDISLLMETFRRTYSWKRAIIGANDETKIDYVLGDIFHSNPQIVGGPQNARYLADPDSFPLYDTYFEIQRRRRKVLLLGSNDGMLHAFDAGVYEEDDPSANEPLTGDFNNGTGREVWSYIPRIQLPVVQMRMASQDHLWGVDGTPTVGDVFIDTKHDGGPFGSERSWRTVAVSGMRRGGRTVFALDVTKPDQMARVQQTAGLGGIEEGWVPTQNDSMPGCMGRDDGTISTPAPGGKVVIPPPTDPANPNEFGNENGQCAWDASTDTQNPALRYPIPLWEFSDDSDWEWNAVTGQHDGNGRLDLGHTWSTPNIGAIMVRDNIDGEDNQGDFPCPDDATLRCQKIFVAIFGGGMDPNGAMNGGAGNWLYMVDVETGKMIYKRELTDGIDVSPGAPDGSAPGGPAAVDTDQDGFLDRVYIGTTEGLIFRVDMTVIPELARPCDDITDPLAIGVQSVCIQDTTWDPKVLFDTVTLETDPFSGGTVASRRPIFFPPAVIFSAELGRYALAFGTGNRNQLWSRAPLGGNRFYVFIDDSDFLISTGPLTEADLVDVSNAQTDPTGRDLLQDRSNGERGWFLRLGEPSPTDPPVTAIPNFTPADETVITSGTAIAGLVSFSSFLPVVQASGGSGNSLATCARTGTSRNYVMLIDNGDAILENCDDTGTCEQRRDESVGTLVSEPFVEQDQTQNPCEGPDCGTTRPPCAGTDAISDVLKERIYPPNCKFGNYRFNLSTMRADTGVECIAQIPVCIIEKNWKEF